MNDKFKRSDMCERIVHDLQRLLFDAQDVGACLASPDRDVQKDGMRKRTEVQERRLQLERLIHQLR